MGTSEEIIQLGNVTPNKWGDQANQGRVYDPIGIGPALTSMQGGGRQPHIIEVKKMEQQIVDMRGRDKTGDGYNQYLEPNNDGTTNTTTTVEKDNLVLEKKTIRIRQATKDGFTEILLGGGGKLGLSEFRNQERQSSGDGTDKSYADNGEYP